MRGLLLALLVLSLPVVSAGTVTLTAMDFHVFIKARVANTGNETVFFSMYRVPDIFDQESFTVYRDYSVGYAYRTEGLWRIYGESLILPTSPGGPPLGKERIFTSRSAVPNRLESTVQGGRLESIVQGGSGWWIKPNEVLVIDIEIGTDATKSFTFSSDTTTKSSLLYASVPVWQTTSEYTDFYDIERRNPNLKIFKWEQEVLFKINNSHASSHANLFVTAPLLIRGARLTTVSDGFVGDLSSVPQKLYLGDFNLQYAAPKWEEWYRIRNALPWKSSPLAATKYSYYPLLKLNLEIPTWRVWIPAGGATYISYTYEWRRDGKYPFGSEGISLSRSMRSVPEWFSWF